MACAVSATMSERDKALDFSYSLILDVAWKLNIHEHNVESFLLDGFECFQVVVSACDFVVMFDQSSRLLVSG
jgi:hypothetical protein